MCRALAKQHADAYKARERAVADELQKVDHRLQVCFECMCRLDDDVPHGLASACRILADDKLTGGAHRCPVATSATFLPVTLTDASSCAGTRRVHCQGAREHNGVASFCRQPVPAHWQPGRPGARCGGAGRRACRQHVCRADTAAAGDAAARWRCSARCALGGASLTTTWMFLAYMYAAGECHKLIRSLCSEAC